MTSSWLLVAEAASLRLPSDGLLLHVVELAATYLVQSTLFLAGGWALLPVLTSLARRRKTKPDGQECPSYGVSPALAERLWKLAAVLALVTAPLSVFTGWSRPAWEWSLREQPPPMMVEIVPREPTRAEPVVLNKPLAPAIVEGRSALPEELAALDEIPPAEILIADEPSAEVIPFSASSSAQDDNLDQPADTEQVGLEPSQGTPAIVESSADLHPTHQDLEPVSVPLLTAEGNALLTTTSRLGIALLAWFAFSLVRLLAKGLALYRRLARCEPIEGELRRQLNRLAPRGRAVRLLRSGPLAPGLVGERVRVRGPNVEDAMNLADGAAPSHLDKQRHGAAAKKEEPLTLTLSPPRRGARGQDTITEPFACGVFRWTIVLPAGIERELSQAELKALLAHEVAHLVRRDPWWLWLGEVLCTCLAFQPLNFLARRRWQQAAEMLCDDWAVERQVSATSLASCLTRIAEGRLDRRAAQMGLSAVGHSGSLTQRIEWLLRTGRATEPKRPRGRTLATLLTFAAGLFVGMYGPRLSFVHSVEAGDDLEAIVAPNESKLWNDIDRDLAETLSELARLDLPLSNDPDPEVVSLANSLRERAASLSEQLAQSVTAASHAERGHK